MKRLVSFASVIVLLAAPAFGATANKPKTVVIPEKVQIGTTQVPAGTYKLEYTGTGTNVQVTLTQSKKTVATFAATAVDKKTANPGVNLITNAGVANLQSINLDKVTFQVNDAPHVGQ
jgi:hypothetical protein